MHVHELCTPCSTAVSHTPYVCSSTTELVKSDSLHARRWNTAQNREGFVKTPSRYDRGASSDDVKKIFTEDVMLLAAIIVRRHLTSTLYVLVCINPVLRWTAEGNSGLGFHQKQSSIDYKRSCVLGSCVLANKLWFGRFAFAIRRVFAALLYWD